MRSASCRARLGQWLDSARLETRWLTVVFWMTVAAFVAAFWVTPFPPCVDYPQHLALSAILRRLFDEGSPDRFLFQAVPLTYHGLFHWIVAALSFVVRPEVAGKLVLSSVPVLTAVAGLSLMRVARRPRWFAFFFLPWCFSGSLGWGFVNYSLAVPAAFLVFSWWIRWLDGEAGFAPRVAVGAFLIGCAHVLVALCLCASVAIALACSSPPRDVGLGRWVWRGVRGVLPYLPMIVFCLLVHAYQRNAPGIFWQPSRDGIDEPAWDKLYRLGSYALGNFWDSSDLYLFWGLAGLLAVLLLAPAFVRSAEGPAPRREFVGLAIGWFLLYLVVPKVLMSAWFIFERLPIWWFGFATAAAPLPGPHLGARVRAAVAMIALVAGLNTIWQFSQIPGADDASAIIDDVPAGARVVGVMHGLDAYPVIRRPIWLHLPAYHQVRHFGEVAVTFTRFHSLLPVRHRPNYFPPVAPTDLEWGPGKFDPSALYAAYYNTVLVRTPDAAPDEDPRQLTFGKFAGDVRLLARHGRFYLYDARPIAARRQRDNPTATGDSPSSSTR